MALHFSRGDTFSEPVGNEHSDLHATFASLLVFSSSHARRNICARFPKVQVGKVPSLISSVFFALSKQQTGRQINHHARLSPSEKSLVIRHVPGILRLFECRSTIAALRLSIL